MTHSVIVEMRPRLQVCHVFITNESLNQERSVRINIKTTGVEVIWFSETCEIVQVINLCEYKLKPLSLSSLQVQKNSLSFRIQTEPASNISGSFASEILTLDKISDSIKTDNSKLLPCISTNVPCQVSCRCCGKVLSKQDIYFTRVLPLPSSWDINDWFCHQHSGASNLQLQAPMPKETDCLYGVGFILFKASLLNIDNGQIIRCNRCMAWLGTRKKSSAKLWKCTSSYGQRNNTSALEDFILTIQTAFKDSFGIACRIVLETKLSDNSSHYLLLWVMDKNLDVLVSANEDDIPFNKVNEHSIKIELNCKLKLKKTMKVLYMYHKDYSDTVKSWQDDGNVQCIEIAKQMFIDGLEYLMKGTGFIPDPYKLTDNFFVTYLGL